VVCAGDATAIARRVFLNVSNRVKVKVPSRRLKTEGTFGRKDVTLPKPLTKRTRLRSVEPPDVAIMIARVPDAAHGIGAPLSRRCAWRAVIRWPGRGAGALDSEVVYSTGGGILPCLAYLLRSEVD